MAGAAYNFSFTAGGLLCSESVRVADEYARVLDWKATIESVQRQNLLQARTASAGDRVLHEVLSRLRLLTPVQLSLLRSGSSSDQRQLLWLATCKRYQLLYEFGSEVIRNKFLQLDLTLGPTDFDAFLESKSIWHPEIEALADSTRAKLRQVALRMLREAEILSADNVIQPLLLAVVVARAIQADSIAHFNVFPVSEADIRRTLS
ncbi:MAG: DUF1819 family protein [Planctomycetota bacterium]|nr:DUF1819 family protein [Planctomycetota bacterium]